MEKTSQAPEATTSTPFFARYVERALKIKTSVKAGDSAKLPPLQ